jgi:hypothetical protein
MSKLQDSVNELVKCILEYETDYWSKSDVQLSKEEAENMAAILINRLAEDINDVNIEDAYNKMYEPPDDPDPLYIYDVQARWTIN